MGGFSLTSGIVIAGSWYFGITSQEWAAYWSAGGEQSHCALPVCTFYYCYWFIKIIKLFLSQPMSLPLYLQYPPGQGEGERVAAWCLAASWVQTTTVGLILLKSSQWKTCKGLSNRPSRPNRNCLLTHLYFIALIERDKKRLIFLF